MNKSSMKNCRVMIISIVCAILVSALMLAALSGNAIAQESCEITTCNKCHGEPPVDAIGGVRNNPPGAVAGTHEKHVIDEGLECTVCHVNNTELNHRNGVIDMADPIAGGYYSKGANFIQVPNPVLGQCISNACHGDGNPTWGGPELGCDGCHGYPPVSEHAANTIPVDHSSPALLPNHDGCVVCHGSKDDGAGNHDPDDNYNVGSMHVNGSITMNATTEYNPGNFGCDSACHLNDAAHQLSSSGLSVELFDGPPGGCIGCHSIEQGNRVAVVNQFGQSSHHVQGVELTEEHCYECHWEANSDGSINNTYHGGWNAPGSDINLVIYGAGARPTSYNTGTAVSYMANGSRSEIQKITPVCLGCHSTQNNSTDPFGDGKTPNEYAWDGQSIDSKYSESGTTPWGKYVDTSSTDITPKNTQTKAYSGHGNASANERGWNLSETWPNTSGAVNVMCYDCHNSHGSNVSGTTTSYASATTNGAMLKDTTAGKQGYSMTYKPTADGSAGQNNAHNAGADLCFDCHTTANAGSTPWGYSGTYNSSQPILGYFDTLRFASGLAGPQQRYSYKAQNGQAKTGHFGVSAPLSTQVNGTIGGLCTPCHDPHGVSPTLNQQYAVPMLKGTWMTSPYKEDVAPASTNECRGRADKDGGWAFCGSSTPGYHIDQNTFANWNFNSTASVSESVNEFGGLCISCHPKSSLSPDTTSQWKSVDRIHNSVKGWDNDGSTKHRYTCSKCHTPHNTALGRLLVTNCLDSAHRGRVASGGRAASKTYYGEEGWGNGNISGGGGNGNKGTYTYWFGTSSGGRACHDNENNDSYPENQLWNVVSPWGELGTGGGSGGCSSYTNKSSCEADSDCEWDNYRDECNTKSGGGWGW